MICRMEPIKAPFLVNFTRNFSNGIVDILGEGGYCIRREDTSTSIYPGGGKTYCLGVFKLFVKKNLLCNWLIIK